MACFDPTTGSVVARILYDGLGMAGKTRSLQRVHEFFPMRSGALYVPEEKKGRTLYFDWLEVNAGLIDEHPLRVQLMTVPGQWVYAHRRWTLLRSPDAIISVVDSTPEGLHRASFAMRFLREVLAQKGSHAPPLLVQANKQDLPGAARTDEVRQRLELGPEVPVVEASAETGDGIRAALVLSIQRAREHIRASLRGESPTTLAPLSEKPEELYASMRLAEIERGDELEGEQLADQILGDEQLVR